MKITAVKATPVSVPLEAPLRHANGCHWGRFVRTIVEVETDEGLTGLGEMGGGGESATAAFKGLERYLLGHDPARLEEMRYRIANPTASLYNNRTQLLAALEFACLDILGQKWGVPVHAILGGALRDRVPFASYLFFRYPNGDDTGEVRTVDQLAKKGEDVKKAEETYKADKDGFVEIVFVIDAGKAVAHPVKTGIQSDELIEIVDGLKEGEEVVTGSYRAISKDLTNGGVVTVNNNPKPAKGGAKNGGDGEMAEKK